MSMKKNHFQNNDLYSDDFLAIFNQGKFSR